MILIPVVQSEPPIDGVICCSIARSWAGRFVGQLSTRAGAIALVSISASDCVAKITDAFFLRSVFSHSRSGCAKLVSSSASQPSSMYEERRPSVEPAFDAVEEIGKNGRRRPCQCGLPSRTRARLLRRATLIPHPSVIQRDRRGNWAEAPVSGRWSVAAPTGWRAPPPGLIGRNRRQKSA